MTCAPVDIDAANYLTARFKFGAGGPTAGAVIRRTALIPHALFAALLLAVAGYAVSRDDAVRNAIQVSALLLMAYGAFRANEARPAWWLLVGRQRDVGDRRLRPVRLNALLHGLLRLRPPRPGGAASPIRPGCAGARRSRSTA